MRSSVDIEKLGDFLSKKLDNWDKKVTEQCNEAIVQTAKEAKKEIKKYTPKRKTGKAYRNSFTIKKFSKFRNTITEVLWNKQYHLSHLLEDGHKVYTRPRGTKNTVGVRSKGPFKIKHRVKANHGSKVSDNMHTTYYEMWEVTQKFAKNNLTDEITKRLKKLKKL